MLKVKVLEYLDNFKSYCILQLKKISLESGYKD